MRSRYSIFLLIILSIFQFAAAGCVALVAGGAAGAGTVVYFKGQLDEEIRAPEAKVYSASISALRELRLPVLEDDHDSFTAKIKSKLANGKDVWISMESVTGGSSKIAIRVGIFGDEEKSRMISNTIHRYI